MSFKEGSPLQLAYQEVPKKWYELSHRGHIILNATSALTLYFSNYYIFHLDSPPVHILGATTFILSALADRYSTVQILKANLEAEQNGIETEAEEANIFLPNIKSPRDFLFSKRALFLDLASATMSAVYPAIGLGWAIGRTHATFNNLRKARRMNRAVEIFNTQKSS